MPKSRSTDPVTSKEAAESVKNVSTTQNNILEILRIAGPCTDEELQELYSWYTKTTISPSGLRSRRSELVAKKLVTDSGLRSKTKANRNTIKWELA